MMTAARDTEDLLARLDRIHKLTDDLAKCQHVASEQMALAGQIHREIIAAKKALKPVK